MATRLQQSTIQYFEGALRAHDKVESFSSREPAIYTIRRVNDMPDVVVILVEIYTLGWAEVGEILRAHRGVNCILVMSNWNHYTHDAKELAGYSEVGLFTMREFLGALNWRHHWKYEKKNP